MLYVNYCVVLSVLQISESVMPDGLHPSALGMARLASCLSPAVSRYAQPRQNTEA